MPDQEKTTIEEQETKIESATGTFSQKLDNKSRIFVNTQMRFYFRDSLSDETDEADCWISRFDDPDVPCVTLMNRTVHNLLLGDKQDIRKSFNKSTLRKFDPDSLEEAYDTYALLRHVKIKTNRIQLDKESAKLLCKDNEERKLIILGQGTCFQVWSDPGLEKHMPDFYKKIKRMLSND